MSDLTNVKDAIDKLTLFTDKNNYSCLVTEDLNTFARDIILKSLNAASIHERRHMVHQIIAMANARLKIKIAHYTPSNTKGLYSEAKTYDADSEDSLGAFVKYGHTSYLISGSQQTLKVVQPKYMYVDFIHELLLRSQQVDTQKNDDQVPCPCIPLVVARDLARVIMMQFHYARASMVTRTLMKNCSFLKKLPPVRMLPRPVTTAPKGGIGYDSWKINKLRCLYNHSSRDVRYLKKCQFQANSLLKRMSSAEGDSVDIAHMKQLIAKLNSAMEASTDIHNYILQNVWFAKFAQDIRTKSDNDQ